MISAILRAFGRASQAVPWNSEESIREELFSIERLEQHAESLAAAQAITPRLTTGRSLAVRLRDNESVLLDAYRTIADAVGEGHAITPAAEWLLDNYHLVEEQIREIRDDLPPGYYRQLPKLAGGPFAGQRQRQVKPPRAAKRTISISTSAPRPNLATPMVVRPGIA